MNDGRYFEDGHIVPTIDAQICGDHAVRVQKVLQNYPEVAKTEDDATEMLEFFEDLLGIESLRRMALAGGKQVTQADPLKVKLLDILTLVIEISKGSSCEQRIKTLCWVLDIPLVDDINGHFTPAEGARREGVRKFTLYKAAAVYAERLGLPPREDQRSEESRKKMSLKLKEKYEERRG